MPLRRVTGQLLSARVIGWIIRHQTELVVLALLAALAVIVLLIPVAI
jgi:hypothetical protein